MSQRIVPGRKSLPDSHIPNPEDTRKSIIELREIYKEMNESAFCVFYQNRYGVKKETVKQILGSVENESSI